MSGFTYGGSTGATYGESSGGLYATPLPRPVTGLTVDNVTEDSVSLSWDLAGSADKYVIYRSRSSGVSTSDYTEVGTTTNLSYSDTNLTNGRTYYYRVAARNNTGEGDLSSEVTDTTNLSGPTITNTDTSNLREIIVEWSLNDNNGEGDVEIYRNSSSLTVITDLTTTAHSDTNSILDGEQYEYYLERDTGDATATSSTVTVVSYLPDVTGLQLDSSTHGEIGSSWDDVLNNGEYRVELRNDDEDSPTWGDAITTTGASHTYTVTYDGEQYSVRARSQTQHVTGSWLSASEISKFIGPDSISASVQDRTTVSISWNNNDNFTGEHRIYYKYIDYKTTSYELLTTTDASNQSVTVNVDQGREHKIYLTSDTDWVTADTGTTTFETPGGPITHKKIYADFDTPNKQLIDVNDVSSDISHTALSSFSIDTQHDDTLEDYVEAMSDVSIYYGGDPMFRGKCERISSSIDGDESSIDIVGRGWHLLRDGASVTYQNISVPDAIEDYWTRVDGFTANVIKPTPEIIAEDIQLQEADTDTEFQDAFALNNQNPIIVSNGLKVAQSNFLEHSVNSDSGIGNGEVGIVEGTGEIVFNGNETAGIQFSNTGDYLEFNFNTDYEIPADSFAVQMRYVCTHSSRNIDTSSDTPPTLEVSIDGTVIETITPAAYADIDWALSSWGPHTNSVSSGSHTVRIECTDPGDSEVDLRLDLVAKHDDRFGYNWDNTVTEVSGYYYLDGPGLYPDSATEETAEIDAENLIDTLYLKATGDTKQLEASFDDGTTWLSGSTIQNNDEYTVTALTRVSLGAHSPNGTLDQTPRENYDGQSISAWEVTADFSSLAVIENEDFTDDHLTNLQNLHDKGNMRFTIDHIAEGLEVESYPIGHTGPTVSWQTLSATRELDMSDYSNHLVLKGGKDANGDRYISKARDTDEIQFLENLGMNNGEITTIEIDPQLESQSEVAFEVYARLKEYVRQRDVKGQLDIKATLVPPGYSYHVSEFGVDMDLESVSFGTDSATLEFERERSLVSSVIDVTSDLSKIKELL